MPASADLVAILGAGAGSRFGGAKLDAELGAKRLGQWSLDAASAAGLPVLFVTGDPVPTFLGGGVEVIRNPGAASGMGSSLALAAREARARGAARLLVMLADMPFVRPETLEALRLAVGPGTAAACRYPDGGLGAPACFDAALFARLEGLGGDIGARRLLASLPGVVAVLAPPRELLDIDSAADLARAEGFL